MSQPDASASRPPPVKDWPPPALYLVPSLLGLVPPGNVLPERTIQFARGIDHWVVETPKAARAFLKAIGHPRAIADLSIQALPEAASTGPWTALLAPARGGHAIGLVSDAGAPAVADPGAALVAAAHASGIAVVPLVGPSSILLALMASGLSGQAFAFHGYLPVREAERAIRLRELEADSREAGRTQLFIETPYRNAAMLATIVVALAPDTRVAIAADLTLPTESVAMHTVATWRGVDPAVYQRRPAIFLLQA
jgi:16S rRNA (cytidine1402-2'-O)-methyltransferase